ncbi:MAG: hypothetical protein HY582_04195 [Candidatus Omnitrophica bacterium]|nr:hypothetical protein [Candidatus Omnitrophota bacterium]
MKTTVAGSYPKIGDLTEEQKLRHALHQFDRHEISEENLQAVQEEVTREVIQEQIDSGIDLVTDGLIRWDDPLTYQAGKILGFKTTGLTRYFDTNTFYREPIVATRLESRKPLLASDYQFAASVSQKPVKAVMTGPYTLAKLSKNEFYRNLAQLAYDLAYIFHQEAIFLEEAGCSVIQFDEPAILHHPQDWQLFLRVYEVVTTGLSKAEKVLFLNFGNLGELYPKICNIQVDTIGCELTKDHPNWKILKSASFTKRLMAGLIDARNTKMETEEEILEIVHHLSEIVPLEKVSLAPSHGLEFLPRSVARKKLTLLAKVAKSYQETKVS